MNSPWSVCYSAYPCSLILPDTLYSKHPARSGALGGRGVLGLTAGLLNLGPGQGSSLLSLVVHTGKRRSNPSLQAAAKSLTSA